jgi:YtkA-like
MGRVFTLLAVLLLVAALAGCATAATVTPGGALAVAMAAEPATPVSGGETTLIFTVTQGGQPLVGARVLVVRRMIGVVHPDDDIVFESVEQGGGRYSAVTSFATPGRWDVQVIVTPAAGEAGAASFEVDVAQP